MPNGSVGTFPEGRRLAGSKAWVPASPHSPEAIRLRGACQPLRPVVLGGGDRENNPRIDESCLPLTSELSDAIGAKHVLTCMNLWILCFDLLLVSRNSKGLRGPLSLTLRGPGRMRLGVLWGWYNAWYIVSILRFHGHPRFWPAYTRQIAQYAWLSLGGCSLPHCGSAHMSAYPAHLSILCGM